MDRRSLPASGPLDLVDEVPLGDDERAYVAAARAADTLQGYRSDWAEWCSWCTQQGLDPLAGEAAAISRYLVFLTGAGAKVGTMARRLSALRFAFRMRGLADPTEAARVGGRVGAQFRRTHGAPADQAAPLMPPELLDVLEACPETKAWAPPAGPRARPGRRPGQGAAARRLRRAFRRSELVALDFDHVNDHRQGLVVTTPRLQDQPGRARARARGPAYRGLPGPLPGAGAAHLGRAGGHQLRARLPGRFHRQQGRRPPPQCLHG